MIRDARTEDMRRCTRLTAEQLQRLCLIADRLHIRPEYVIPHLLDQEWVRMEQEAAFCRSLHKAGL